VSSVWHGYALIKQGCLSFEHRVELELLVFLRLEFSWKLNKSGGSKAAQFLFALAKRVVWILSLGRSLVERLMFE